MAQRQSKGVLGWLGRQVGYVKTALATKVTERTTIYRTQRTQERPVPGKPKVTARRTVTDEIIVEKGRIEQ